MKKNLLALIVIVGLGLSTATLAQDKSKKKGKSFEEAKASRLAKVARRKASLEKQEACLKASVDWETMKSCNGKRKKRKKSKK